MTWRPSPQGPCPCKFRTGGPVVDPELPPSPPVIEAPEPRTCTPEDPCSFCGPVERFWASDPAPAEAPAVPSPFGFTEFGQHTPPPRIGIIDRIRNATRRNT